MLSQNEIQAMLALIQRVDLKGSEAITVANLQVKLQRMLEEPQKEAEKLDKKIDEANKTEKKSG